MTLFAVALIWGITNPFMKSGVQGLEKVKKSSLMKQLVAELWHLVKSWRVRISVENLSYCTFKLYKEAMAIFIDP